MSSSEENPKLAKKLAKAAAKAAKKQAAAGSSLSTNTATPAEGRSPAERAADAAERQVTFQRWRVILAAIGAAIALITLLVIILR